MEIPYLFTIEEEDDNDIAGENEDQENTLDKKEFLYHLFPKPSQTQLIQMCCEIIANDKIQHQINYYGKDRILKLIITSFLYEHHFSTLKGDNDLIYKDVDEAESDKIREKWTPQLLKLASTKNSCVEMELDDCLFLIFCQDYDSDSRLYCTISFKLREE
jgi:hypothetical protein